MKQNKRTAGFTLVELIVVIAIMGILAGVGTVGYSGYIKSANKNTDKTTIGEVYRAIDTAGKTYAYDVTDVGQASDNGLQIPVGFIMLTNGKKTNGDTGDTLKVISTNDEVGVANKAMLESVLSDTFGSGYAADLKLLSNVWTDSTIPVMFAETKDLYSSMKGLTTVLADTANGKYGNIAKSVVASKFANLNNYKDGDNVVGEKVVAGMATSVASIDKETFLNIWMNVETNGKTDCAFGLASKGVEAYTAARRAYNEGFAAYVESRTDVKHDLASFTYGKGYTIKNDKGSATDHASQITGYGLGVERSGLVVSDVICTEAFSSDALRNKYDPTTASSGYLNDDVQQCEHCLALYGVYKDSEQCRQNGIAFYDAMVTIAETQDTALNNESGFWGYYDTYIGNFSDLYTGVQAEQDAYESAVVLTVYYQNGMLVAEVSPNNYLDA